MPEFLHPNPEANITSFRVLGVSPFPIPSPFPSPTPPPPVFLFLCVRVQN